MPLEIGSLLTNVKVKAAHITQSKETTHLQTEIAVVTGGSPLLAGRANEFSALGEEPRALAFHDWETHAMQRNRTRFLLHLLIALVSVSETLPTLANNGRNFVSKRYYCQSAEKEDVGDRTISADGPTCDASRQQIQSQTQGDVCRAYDRDWWWTGRAEEIQVTGCPRQP
jgi:hypothetical protein